MTSSAIRTIVRMPNSIDEQAAVVLDAQRRLHELRNVERALLPDSSEVEVLAELLWVRSEIQVAERALAEVAA